MDRIISPISIDLGGKYTGVCLTHYLSGVIPDKQDTRLSTIVMPDDGGSMTWSQVSRTTNRHRVRNNKRRKLAKRLMKVAIEHAVSRSLSSHELNALNGLLNRRGYNRLEIELDLSSLDQAPSAFFAKILPDYFVENIPVSIQWDSIKEDLGCLRSLQQESNFQFNKKDAKTLFTLIPEDIISTEEHKDCLSSYHLLQHAVSDSLKTLDEGHQHRCDYLNDIKEELCLDNRLNKLRDELSADDLYRLIGNISNFQLRNLRWYFNNERMKRGDFFDGVALLSTTKRWLEGWHPESDAEKQNRTEALNYLRRQSGGLEALIGLDPRLTIPPYEDQNNRRPPKDQTLWLNPVALNKLFGDKWLIWAKNLHIHNEGWDKGIQENLVFYERKSRLQRHYLQAPDAQYAEAVFLQRIFDRSRILDPYALRLISNRSQYSNQHETYLNKLSLHIGSQHLDDFLKLVRSYYEEVDRAKQGIWFQNSYSLLEKADINPPSKTKITNRLIGNVLGCELSADGLERFKENVWLARVPNMRTSTVRSICKKVEEVRKSYGNSFNYELQKITYRIQNDSKAEKLLKGTDKEIWDVHNKAMKTAEFIANKLGHNKDQANLYSNSFSMAQLYTILETDRHGFSKISVAAHNETAWRMQTEFSVDGKKSARCTRLAADSVRPFDGILRRILDRQAYEIANLKISQLNGLNLEGQEILVPIIAEENRFEFSLGLATIKKAGKKKYKDLVKGRDLQLARWQDKLTRIKESAFGICPYTGENIGQIGEIDHIVPRSQSVRHNNTVFNSEANLIWSSRKGNQSKSNRRILLKDLHPHYLEQLFGTSVAEVITEQIEKNVSDLPEQFIFVELTKQQQIAVRHALFLTAESGAYRKVFASLATQQTTRVNGTQAWLIKRIIELLEKEFADTDVRLKFVAARVNAEQTSVLRRQLAEIDKKYEKAEVQSVASHSLDALCAYVTASMNELHDDLALASTLGMNTDNILNLIPDYIDTLRVERKPKFEKQKVASQAIFKESIYAEHFLPIWLLKDKINIGFDGYDRQSLLTVQSKDPVAFLESLKPVISQAHRNFVFPLDQPLPVKLAVDKSLAFQHLQKVAKQPCPDSDLLLAKLLEALRYTTSNKDCKGTIFDERTSKFKTTDEVLKDKNFNIKVDLVGHKLGRVKGNLTLPSKNDWKNLLAQPELQSRLGTKNADGLDWHALFGNFFKSGSKRIHSKARRNYSLPIIDAPSGGFRVMRKSPTGEIIWQLVAQKDSLASGFYVENNKISWNHAVSLDLLISRNIVEVNSCYKKALDMRVSFSKWLTLECDHPDITKLEMAPGSKDRRYIRITQPFDVFQKWLKASSDDVPDSFWAVGSEIKVDAVRFANAHGEVLLGKPRSNLFIERLGDYVIYRYKVVEQNSLPMKNAYQKAYESMPR